MSGNREKGENIEMDPSQVEELCDSVSRQGLALMDIEIQIQHYMEIVDREDRKFAEIQQQRKIVDAEIQELEQQNKQLEFFKRSVEQDCVMAAESLLTSEALKRYTEAELKQTQQEALKHKEELDNMIMEAQKKISEDSRSKELQKAKAEALIADMRARQLELDVRTRKSIIAQRAQIEKKQFQNFCIQLAEHYVLEQKRELLKSLKAQEIEETEKLIALQEKAARVKTQVKISNTTYEIGNQDTREAQAANKTEPVLQNTQNRKKMHNKLHLRDVFAGEGMRQIEDPQMIPERLLDAPLREPEWFGFPKKRKVQGSDLSGNWLERNATPRASKSCASTQESEANISQVNISQASDCSLDDKILSYKRKYMPTFKKPLPVEVQYPMILPEQYQSKAMETEKKDGYSMMSGPTSQSVGPPTLTSQPVSTAVSQMIPQSILSTSKDPNAINRRDYTFEDQPKTVRFNLEKSPSPLNTPMAFEEQNSMGYNVEKQSRPRKSSSKRNGPFSGPFDFFTTASASSSMFNFNDDREQPPSFDNSFTRSLPEGEDREASGLDMSGNENNSYGSYGDGEEAPEARPASGFFSFGPSSMFSFNQFK